MNIRNNSFFIEFQPGFLHLLITTMALLYVVRQAGSFADLLRMSTCLISFSNKMIAISLSRNKSLVFVQRTMSTAELRF